jgi:hypothetical protein
VSVADITLQSYSRSHARQDGPGADVRVGAERKPNPLEADLATAERAKKERALATRYPQGQVFWCVLSYAMSALCASYTIEGSDRQKLLRRIRQTKWRLEDEEVSPKVRKALSVELFDLRQVDLKLCRGTSLECRSIGPFAKVFRSQNYPKLERHISLFPPDVRSTDDAAAPVHPGASSSATTERDWVRARNEYQTGDIHRNLPKRQRWELLG